MLFIRWSSVRRAAPAGADIHDVYVFTEPREAEIASRCCRSWVDEDTLTPSEVALGERILKAGIALFPKDAMLAAHYGNYLLDVMHTYNAGIAQMQVHMVSLHVSSSATEQQEPTALTLQCNCQLLL